MPTEPKPGLKEITLPTRVVGTCPDGHIREFEMAPLIAQVGSITGEQCPVMIGAKLCGKYLKVTKVYGAAAVTR